MTHYTPADEAGLLAIRKTIIVAIASDDELMERLVLKGGNALDIIYHFTERSSLDIDFSMSGDFVDQADLAHLTGRLFAALRDRFDSIGYVLFDEKMESRPREKDGPGITVWGGYQATFKLIARDRFLALGGIPGEPPAGPLLEAIRRESQVTGLGSQRNFTIEVSKFEYCEGRVLRSVDDYDCYVYTPAMIAAEKLRAICQQLPAYELRKHPAPRPRDFFDIHSIATQADCDLTAAEHLELIRQMFRVKQVPLALIGSIGTAENRAFHAQQWPAVRDAVRGGVRLDFDFYFDFVVAEAQHVLAALEAGS